MNVTRSLDQGGETNATYEFEVATIKPTNPEGSPSGGVEIAGLEVTIGSVPLHSLIDIAWGVAYWQIDTKGVEWITKNMYDVRAKAPELKPGESYSPLHSWYSIQDPRLRKMLQALLLDRFQLKAHKEQRTAPVYLLRRNDRKKLTLVPADTGQNGVRRDPLSNTIGNVVGRGFSIHDMSMPGLAKTLSNYVYHHEVLDHTGLTGSYNFESKTILTEEDFRSQDLASTFVAAVKEMGLEMEKTEGPTDFLVVDSASLPSPN